LSTILAGGPYPGARTASPGAGNRTPAGLLSPLRPPSPRADHPDMRRPVPRPDRADLSGTAAISVTLTAVLWAVTGRGGLWPTWVTVAVAVALALGAHRALRPGRD
jgi:hypothetical protein